MAHLHKWALQGFTKYHRLFRLRTVCVQFSFQAPARSSWHGRNAINHLRNKAFACVSTRRAAAASDVRNTLNMLKVSAVN